ncbi:MAG: hypothetical protein K2G64_02970, partial [Muribaculaceae bacterium]|nr:hypothetical protein [Muribaculaceae bacterium]
VVGLLLRQFSKLVVSATHPPLLVRALLPLRLQIYNFRLIYAIASKFLFGYYSFYSYLCSR